MSERFRRGRRLAALVGPLGLAALAASLVPPAAGKPDHAGPDFVRLQNSTPGSPQSGHATITGTLTAGAHKGDGSQLTNVRPSGPAGGDLAGTYPNPTIAPGAVTNAKIASVDWSKITNAPAALDPERIILVAKSGGHFASVQAALDSVTDAGPAKRYLVKIAPGVYPEVVSMKPYVDIEGSGEGVTRILAGGSGGAEFGAVNGADNAELRNLTAEADGGGGLWAVAIRNHGVSPSLRQVTAIAHSANSTMAVYNVDSSATLDHVTASSSALVFESWGVTSQLNSSITMRNSQSTGNPSFFCYVGSARLANSQLTGPTRVENGGSLKQVGCYDENFDPLP